MTIYYTGRGDRGRSWMGTRPMSKDDPLIVVLGTLDELNSWVGLCRAESTKFKKVKDVGPILKEVQEALFVAQAEVASLGLGKKATIKLASDKVTTLEKHIRTIDQVVPNLKKFIIPGASELSARLDVARSIARTAERTCITLSKKRRLSPVMLQYLNRLSSLLFALARYVNVQLKITEDNPQYK